ncbi:MAG: transglycosylase SLT domain-containing protein [Pseudomonadota bacterium]
MTDAILSATTAQAAVSGALKKASQSTGVGFDYLYRVAMRESSLNPSAKAKTSSAAGLFQFIDQTWLGAVKKYGAAHGLAAEAADIKIGDNGKLSVADPQRRKEILDLRLDPEKASALAGELARENKSALEGTLGRAVDAAELYAAHFLGAGGAKKLLSAGAHESAAALLPAAAEANRHVFYDGARARSVGEVIDSFRRTIGEAQGAIRDIGERIEKSLAPLLRETAIFNQPLERASFAPRPQTPGFEMKGLSPLVLAVLQALDPRDIGKASIFEARDRE